MVKVGDFDSPVRVRVDPADPLHLYVGDGVTGRTNGFWVSTDGGDSWAMPQGFRDVADSLHDYDVYHVAPDPADFRHVLVTFHYYWNGGNNAGIIESFDGGDTWIVHQPHPDWAGAGGYNVFFLYDPVRAIGDAQTWLYGTQGAGYWRTTDAGSTWTKVSDVNLQHGGGSIYYTNEGVLYVSGDRTILRSDDNGATFTEVGPRGAFLSVIGDGNFLYTAPHFGPSPFLVAPEDDDQNWTPFDPNGHQFREGPFEMAFDAENRILYAACITDGIWALKVPAP